jgi:recombination protein RecA
MKEEKKSITEVLKELNKQYGNGSVLMGQKSDNFKEIISTGSVGLDLALGVKGIPKRAGKIIEIIGWESCGKSTLSQTIIANFQKAGEKCLMLDGENSLDYNYSKNLGINMDDLLIIQLDETAGEGAYNKMEQIVETGEIGLVVIDSYNSLQPLKLIQEEVGTSTIGLHARLMNQAVMKANYLATKYGTNFIFIGQLRNNIGVMFGSNEVTQGGNALKFYSHVRLTVTRSTTTANSVMEGETKIGNKTTVKVLKNKLSLPFKSCTFNIIYGEGIDTVNELIELAKEKEVLKLRAGIVTYNEEKYPYEQFVTMIEDNPDFMNELRNKILG